jgi:hypothetical protein
VPATAEVSVEVLAGVFGIITRQAIRRGSFLSVDDLERVIRAFIDAYNDHATPVRLGQDRRRAHHQGHT